MRWETPLEQLSFGCTNTHTTSIQIYCPPPHLQLRLTCYPQGPPHHTQVQSHHTGYSFALRVKGRSLLEGTLDAALICLVAQVVVHFKRAFMEFQVFCIPQLPQEIRWLFQTFQIFIRTSPCLSPSKLGHSILSLSAFVFYKATLFPSPYINSRFANP